MPTKRKPGRKPKPRRGHTACIINNYLVVMGGKNDNSDYHNDLWIFVFRTQNELGEKQGWYKLQVVPIGETEDDHEFTDLHTGITQDLRSQHLGSIV